MCHLYPFVPQINRLRFGSLHIAIQSFCCRALMLQPATYSHSSIDSLRSFLFGLRASCMFLSSVHVKCLWSWLDIKFVFIRSSILWIVKKMWRIEVNSYDFVQCYEVHHVQRWQISTTTAESSAAASQGAALVETWDPWQPVPMPCCHVANAFDKRIQRMILQHYLILLDGQIFNNIHSLLIPSFLLVSFQVCFGLWVMCLFRFYSVYSQGFFKVIITMAMAGAVTCFASVIMVLVNQVRRSARCVGYSWENSENCHFCRVKQT